MHGSVAAVWNRLASSLEFGLGLAIHAYQQSENIYLKTSSQKEWCKLFGIHQMLLLALSSSQKVNQLMFYKKTCCF
jgi:hypothetical protein